MNQDEVALLALSSAQKMSNRTLAATGAALIQLTSGAISAAKAQAALAKASSTVTKAVKNMVSGFDELHIAAQDTESIRKKPGGGSAGKGKNPLEEMLPEDAGIPAWLQALRAYIETYLAPSIAAWQAAFTQVRTAADEAFSRMRQSAEDLTQNALLPLQHYLLQQFIPQIVNGFSQAFAPLFADIASAAISIFAAGFETACRITENAVNTLLLPALQLVERIFTDMFTAVSATWEAYGPALIEGIMAAADALFSLVEMLYTTVFQPIIAAVIEALSALWNESLAPLWENLLAFFASASEALLALWNNILAPFLSFLTATFGPVLATLGSSIAQVFATVAGTIANVVSGIVQALQGLMEFLCGVFTGDWARAWQGIESIFGGVWNGIVSLLTGAVNSIIRCVNVMTSGVASAINAVTSAINSISLTIPAWVPGFGGKSIGFSLPSVSAPQIPLLAKGAVIPPNASFLAVLGDQKSGRNLEAPEALVRQIVREESGGSQVITAEQPVELSLDGDVLYRAMLKIKAQRGSAIGGVFVDVF